MKKIRLVRHTLLIAAISILTLRANAGAASTHRADLSAAALKELTPEGYKIEKTIACEPGPGAQHEHLVALADADDHQIAAKPVMLLLVAAGKKILVEESVILHNDANTGKFWDGQPNYFSGLTRENVGGGDLFLVKSFSHGRMDQTYFAVYKNAIYDAESVCTRGEKRGKAYVYTCYLQVTKYA